MDISRSANSACMTSAAIVRAVHDDGTVDVELSGAAGCRGCEGACTWRRLPAVTTIAVGCVDPAISGTLAAGDAVSISLPADRVLAGAVLLYGAPMTGLLAGAVIGGWLGAWSDLAVLVGAASGAAVAIAALRPARRRVEASTVGQLRLAGRL